MKSILKTCEKILQKYLWILPILYIIGYLLIRIQFAKHGISEVQIFKERYILASVLFIIYYSPILIFEYMLDNKRKKGKTNKIEIVLSTIILSLGCTYLITLLPAILYSDTNYENMADFNIFIIIGAILLIISEILQRKFKIKDNKITIIYFITGIFMFIGLSIGTYKSYNIKEEWLNMYITSFFIIQTILVIRLLVEKFYVRKIQEDKEKKINIVKVMGILITLLLYGNFVFKSLPLEIGGGKLTSVDIKTENKLLLEEISNKNTYLLDRNGSTYLLVVEENEEENLYKTIEVSKSDVLLSIERKVVINYFK